MAQNVNDVDINIQNLSINVQGDLESFQNAEDKSDSDEDVKNVKKMTRMVDVVPEISSSMMKPSSSPAVIGTVSITDSENVVIGNNTYFNGPVTIKQVIHSTRGVENSSYMEVGNQDVPKNQSIQITKQDTSIKRSPVKNWNKIICSVVCIIMFGIILAMLSIIFSRSSQEDATIKKSSDDGSSYAPNYTTLVGFRYENINLIIFTIILVPVTFLLMFNTLLTFDYSGDKEIKHSDVIEDIYDPHSAPVVTVNGIILGRDHLRVVSRSEWLAQPVDKKLHKMRQPVPWVIISHTATESCSTMSECVLRVRLIQTFHIESKEWDDIGYNFLVAGDGSAYFGRGWDYIGAHTLGYNRFSIGISFIGTFNSTPPPQKQLDACKNLLKMGVALGKLHKNYKLFAHRQLAPTLSPGDCLYNIIKEWPHFVKNFTDIKELLPGY